MRRAPFETGTESGRARERHRRILLTILSSLASKAVQAGVILLSVPLSLHHLGPERFGLLMTVTSFILLFGFADLGISLGLLNAIAEAHGRDDRELARRHVSSAFFLLSGVAMALAAAGFAVYPLIPWADLFNLASTSARAEAGPALAAFLLCFILNLPLAVVFRIQGGYQETYKNNWWESLGSLLSLVGILLAVQGKAGVVVFIFAMAGAPILAIALNAAILFLFDRPWLRPRRDLVNLDSLRTIGRNGLLFFVLQLAVAASLGTDNIIAAKILGMEAVAELSVASRLFNLIPMALSVLLLPLWPAYGEALARGDAGWIRRTLIRSLYVSFLFSAVIAGAFFLAGRWLIELWVGPSVLPSPALLAALGFWMVFYSVATAYGIFLNGTTRIAFQVWCCCCLLPVATLAKVALTRSIGLPGIVLGALLANLLCSNIPALLYIPGVLKHLPRGRQGSNDPGADFCSRHG